MYSPGLKDSLSTGNATIGKVKIVDDSNNVIGSTQQLDGSYHLSTDIVQNVFVSAKNSSTTNVNAGQSFTGTSESTLGVNGIQVTLKTDVNCHVYIEQSPDGTNWDIVDEFDYFYSTNNFSTTVMAVNSYFRTVVTNIGITNSTYFRLQSVLCPILNPMPRALDESDHIKVHSFGNTDEYGFESENTPNGESRMIVPTSLVGKIFEGATLDTNFWTATLANGGTVTQGNTEATLRTNTTANGSAKLTSVRRARYVPGQSHVARFQLHCDSGGTDNTRKWGVAWGATMPTITDGLYFQLSGTTFSVVSLKGGTPTVVSSGNFNGKFGATYALDTNHHVFEIYWNNNKVFFTIEGKILHTLQITDVAYANTIQYHIYLENTNANSAVVDKIIMCSSAGIRRLGPLLSQPTAKYQSGTTTGVICKYGTGNIHGIIISGVVNNSQVILYDNTAASGTVLWDSGAMTNQTVPFDLNFHGVPFFTGLTLVISGANCNVNIQYE